MKANELECKSISIPAISSGIFGFPKPLCAKTFFKAIEDFWIKMNEDEEKLLLKEIRLTNFD
jgi:O-acetyl-ADP-ribose deacetylase (regulator of RNase III)